MPEQMEAIAADESCTSQIEVYHLKLLDCEGAVQGSNLQAQQLNA